MLFLFSPLCSRTPPGLALGPVLGGALLLIYFPWLVSLPQHLCCCLFHLLVVLPKFLIKYR